MVRRVLVALAAVCLGGTAVLPASSDAARDDPIRFALGILRRDGILLPFAAFDNGKWSVPWPLSPRNITRPIALDDVPEKWWGPQGPDAPWQAFVGDRQIPLRLQRPIEYPVFCTTGFGIATDHRGAPADRREPTAPKDGVALAGNATVLPLPRVGSAAPVGREIVELITPEFNAREKEASRLFTRWSHPFDDQARQALPIQLETLVRSEESRGKTRWTLSYIEAVRAFPPGPKDDGCGLITYVHGWVIQRPDRKPKADLQARITYCDRAGVSFVQPFGRLRVKNDTYWVLGFSSWRDEEYVVMRVRPDEVRAMVAVSGGSCPR